MADRPLHSDTVPTDLQPEPKKRGLRGAAGGVFTGLRTTPNRTTDFADGAGAGVAQSGTRPTGRAQFVGDGVPGGSRPQGGIAAVGVGVIDTTGRAVDTTRISAIGPSGTRDAGALKYTNFDGRTTNTGEGGKSLGADGRGSAGHNAAFPGGARPTMIAPLTGTAANPAAGTVELDAGGGAGAIQCDLNAADITGGASGYKGVEVEVFSRSGDTDEDLALVQKFSFDSTTEADANNGTAIPAGTYAVYARFKGANGSLGPPSLRSVVAVS
jgi:hypothetical protein